MKLAFKHKVVLPDVERVLRDAARVDAGFLRFPRPIDEIITLCYPLAIQEIVGLDSRKARAEMAKLGGPAYEESSENQKLAGFLFTRSDGGVILLESGRTSEARKRFTKAHELGHFVLQALPRIEERGATADLFEPPQLTQRFSRHECTPKDLAKMDNKPQQGWLHEVRANYFAAELLMPVEEIRAQLRQSASCRAIPSTDELVATLSRHFGVSREAMGIRLTDLEAMELPEEHGSLMGLIPLRREG